MKLRSWLCISSLLLGWVACQSPKRNYRKISDKIGFSLLAFDDTAIVEGTRWLVYSDSVSQANFLRLNDLDTNSSLYHVLPYLHPGDSIRIYLFKGAGLFSPHQDTLNRTVDLRIDGFFDNWQEMPRIYKGPFLFQKAIKQNFSGNPEARQLCKGVWIKYLILSGNPNYSKGDEVLCQFTGVALDSSFRDTLFAKGLPFKYFLGQEYQLIPGLDSALHYMAPGDEALILLSSDMAYGKNGSSSGLVKPHTPMQYELKALKPPGI